MTAAIGPKITTTPAQLDQLNAQNCSFGEANIEKVCKVLELQPQFQNWDMFD